MVQQTPVFVDITESAIIDEKPIGSFISIRDFDTDGLDDILIDNRLYKNISHYKMSFYEVTKGAGLQDAKGHGTFIDLNDDSCPDIIFYGRDYDIQIYKNDCKGIFSKIQNLQGFESCKYTEAIAYLYHRYFYYPLIYCATYEENGRYFRDFLYATNGDFSFFDISYLIKSRWFEYETPSRCAVSGDINNDNMIDIYVCNYRLFPNFMLLLESSGVFTNEAINLDTASVLREDSRISAGSHTIGATLSDLNNDGHFEIVLANLSHNDYERGMYNVKSQIFTYDRKNKKFYDIRRNSGINIDDIGSNINGMYKDELFSNVVVSDFNNDGFKDILFTQVYDKSYSYGRFFTAISDAPYFAESTFASIPLFYDSLGAALSDLNRDGCIDIVVAGKKIGEKNRRLMIFQNICNYSNDYIEFKLCNRFLKSGVDGSKVRIYLTKDGEKKILLGQVEAVSSGFGQQNSDIIHFGLGSNYKIERIEVDWNSGTFQLIYDFKINSINYIVEQEPICKITRIHQFHNLNYIDSNCGKDNYYLFLGNTCSNEFQEIGSDYFTLDFSQTDNFCKDLVLMLQPDGVGRKYLLDELIFD